MADVADRLIRLRDDALAIGRAGVDAVLPARVLGPALDGWVSRRARAGRRVFAIAAGKAGAAMMRAFLDAGGEPVRGLVASTHVREGLAPRIETLEAGHPVPTAASEAAATRALAIAAEASSDDAIVVLLSGGASAILAAPAPGLTLEDKVATTRLLLESGAAIHELNAVRKHLSAIKGGRLALRAACAVDTLAISDVVGDDPSVIGSGPTVADPTTFTEALDVLDRFGLRARVPAAVADALEAGRRGGREETPKPGDPAFARGTFSIVGGRSQAMDGARGEAIARGYATVTLEAPIVGEARVAGPDFVSLAARVASRLPRPACVIASGETIVRVTGRGRGGRNQEVALSVAADVAAPGSPAVFMSLGTDGVDGPTDAAGAVVDSTTVARAAARGIGDARAHLAENDAYTYFDALGDLIRIGPTDTNVGDLQILLLG